MEALAPLFLILSLAIGVAQLIIGFMGIEFYIGTFGAIIVVVLCLMFRFTLPLTLGTFFGAIEVLNWPWYYALLIAAPGLLFMIPAFIGIASSSFGTKQNF